jgi:hypothetical protein
MSLSSSSDCNPVLNGSVEGSEWSQNCITYDLLVQKNKLTITGPQNQVKKTMI